MGGVALCHDDSAVSSILSARFKTITATAFELQLHRLTEPQSGLGGEPNGTIQQLFSLEVRTDSIL